MTSNNHVINPNPQALCLLPLLCLRKSQLCGLAENFFLALIVNSLSIKRAYTIRSKTFFLNTSNILIQRMTCLEILALFLITRIILHFCKIRNVFDKWAKPQQTTSGPNFAQPVVRDVRKKNRERNGCAKSGVRGLVVV